MSRQSLEKRGPWPKSAVSGQCYNVPGLIFTSFSTLSLSPLPPHHCSPETNRMASLVNLLHVQTPKAEETPLGHPPPPEPQCWESSQRPRLLEPGCYGSCPAVLETSLASGLYLEASSFSSLFFRTSSACLSWEGREGQRWVTQGCQGRTKGKRTERKRWSSRAEQSCQRRYPKRGGRRQVRRGTQVCKPASAQSACTGESPHPAGDPPLNDPKTP